MAKKDWTAAILLLLFIAASSGKGKKIVTAAEKRLLAEMRDLAVRLGFPDPNMAAAIAMAESGGNPDAVSATGDVGLWQINLASHPQYDKEQLHDPLYNGTAALAISQRGKNWNPWTTFKSGAYKPFLAALGVAVKGT